MGHLDTRDHPDRFIVEIGDQEMVPVFAQKAIGRLGQRRIVEQCSAGVHIGGISDQTYIDRGHWLILRAVAAARLSVSMARDSGLVGTADMESARGYNEFVDAVASEMGLGDAVRRAGTTVVAAEGRAGSSMVVVYWIAEHTVLWCDPAVADDLSELVDASNSKSQAEISSWATRVGWGDISIAQMQLLRATGIARPGALASVEIRSLDREQPGDVALIDAFKASLTDADRDEADLDGDRLDAHIVAVVDDLGIASFASQQPFVYADRFADIAVATRTDVRGRGLGRIAVAALCDEIESSGMLPLYRCESTNLGSVGVSGSLGFVPVLRLSACRRP